MALKETPPSFSPSRRRKAALYTAATVGLTLYIVLLANVILYRHPLRFDWTQERLYSLSEETLKRLELVREPIDVIIPTFLSRDNPEHVAYYRVLERARALLNEYVLRQPLIRIAAEIDVYREPDRWRSLCEEYELAPTQWNRIIFVAAEARDYRQSVTPRDMARFRPATGGTNLPPEIEEFRVERALTSAIVRLIHRERLRVYFTQDKGEPSLKPTRDRPIGLGAVRHELDLSGFEPKPLELSKVREIPEDCTLLVIAGPEERYSPSELETIERYLLRDGRLFVAVGGRRTGLESLLEKWGVKVEDRRLVTRTFAPGTKVEMQWVSATAFNRTHPITKPFTNAPRFELRLFAPRPLELGGGRHRLTQEMLAATAAAGENVRYYLEGEGGSETGAKEDFVLAAAVWQPPMERPPPEWEQRRTRIVVVSAANFLRDPAAEARVRAGFLSASHRDFFMNCVEWLAGREELAAAAGQAEVSRSIEMDPSIRRFLFLSSVVIFPGVFLCLGAVLYFARRT